MTGLGHRRAFTIVELLIVIAAIGIIATIVIVSYQGISGSARLASLKSDIQGANELLSTERVTHRGVWQPNEFPASMKASPGNYLELTAPTAAGVSGHCINGYRGDPAVVYSYDSERGFSEGLCPYLPSGDTRGTAPNPLIPRGVNIAANFEHWTLMSGSTNTLDYEPQTEELVIKNNSGTYTTWISPKIRVSGARTATMTVLANATQASTTFTPEGGVYSSLYFFAADCTTPVPNPHYLPDNSYTANGSARPVPLNQWSTVHVWNGMYIDKADPSEGTDAVQCIQFSLMAGNGIQYVSTGTRYKDFKITLGD